MAVLGFQLVTTLIGACILSKVVTYFPFTRFLFNGLRRLLPPSDQSLLDASGNLKLRNKGKKRHTEASNGGVPPSQAPFYFSRAISIHLQPSDITYTDVLMLPLYSSLQWLVDFTVCAVGIYLVTEFYHTSLFSWINAKSPNQTAVGSFSTRLDLSLIWMALVAWFALRSLISLAAIYFRQYTPEVHQNEHRGGANNTTSNTGSGEWFLIVAAGFCFLIAAGFFMLLDDRYFDFGLQTAYTNLTVNTTFSPNSPLLSWGAFNAILALSCATVGALFVYPGMKFGKIYMDAVSKNSTPLHRRILFHITFILPLFTLLLWVKPITDHLHRSLVTLTFNPTVMRQPIVLSAVTLASELLTTELNTLRLLSSILVVILRLMITRWNLQVYLNSAQDKLDRFNREPGQTSNKEVQRLVASIFYCLNLVALQWVGPTVLLLSVICLFKSMAGLSWIPFRQSLIYDPSTSATTMSGEFAQSIETADPYTWIQSISEARSVFNQFISIVAFRAIGISRGVLGFLVWWFLFSLQSVSLLGLAYHRFTSEQ